MGSLLDTADRVWTGADAIEARHPFEPLFEAEEIARGIGFVSGFANVASVSTDDGLVLVDVGSFLTAVPQHALVRRLSTARVHTAIYTHGHVDHVMGLGPFEDEARARGEPKIEVVAHASVPLRFDRYRRTPGLNAHVNRRQFGLPLRWPTEYRYPDRTFGDALSLDVGGTRLELRHARGETDDHAWVWAPASRTVFTGDLFIWASPNAGNPQKVQRYPDEWARALRAMAALRPALLSPGHGLPIAGEDRVQRALTETAELLEALVEKTLALMNEGATLDQVLAEVSVPLHLAERPYLQPIYDEPEFVVRNVWRLYGGWWDGDPASLKPAPRAKLGAELAALAGGPTVLSDRALALSELGDHRLACHLVELAFLAAPGDHAVRAARGRVYSSRSKHERSLMAQGVYRTAAEETKVEPT